MTLTTERMTKMERFIRSLVGNYLCSAVRVAIRRHRGKTALQAWRTASDSEMKNLCGWTPGVCWCLEETADVIRKRHPTPPAAVMRAYRRVK